jgi:iron(II)-dependent oxidoreductase
MSSPDAHQLAAWALDARHRTLALVEDLSPAQCRVPRIDTLNPPLWELGHVAWFQERWMLREAASRPPILSAGDALYDSMRVAHDTRWDLPLPPREEILAYCDDVLGRTLERLTRDDLTERDAYFAHLTTFHEDMHDEALIMMRQAQGYPAVPLDAPARPLSVTAADARDLAVPGGRHVIGTRPGPVFVFDNEKWAHEAEVAPFAIAARPVTEGEWADFVADDGYARRALWSDEGWSWRREARAEHPLYWRRGPDGWERRRFDTWAPIEPLAAMTHVCLHEAQAYCRWAGRRLPTEAEWEVAALVARDAFAPSVGAWEWTSSPFEPYPGFSPDPYDAYSQPWFFTHHVLRGGSWASRPRMLHPSYRNFYLPHRRDVIAGLRTCAP